VFLSVNEYVFSSCTTKTNQLIREFSGAYGTVKNHNGEIFVESKIGIGTTFKIYLPLHSSETDPSETTANEETTDHVHGKGEKILVVEDDPAIRSLAETALQNAGYIAVTATSAAEAKQIFTEEKGGFDLLFSDVVLPDENGTELAETLLKNKPGLRILLCSGYSGGRIQQNAFFKKHVFFLEKPFSIVNLLKTVHQALTSNK